MAGSGTSAQLYVGGLSPHTSEEQLTQLFERYGAVDRVERKERFAFIWMNEADADVARRELHQSDFDGGKISVEVPRSRQGQDRGGRKAEPRGSPDRCIVVENLNYRTGWQDLKDRFKEVVDVMRADIDTDERGRSRGSGLVEVRHRDEVDRAIRALNGTDLGGRTLRCKPFSGGGGPERRTTSRGDRYEPYERRDRDHRGGSRDRPRERDYGDRDREYRGDRDHGRGDVKDRRTNDRADYGDRTPYERGGDRDRDWGDRGDKDRDRESRGGAGDREYRGERRDDRYVH
eukprot:TRINITY_DN8244_c0_g1_i1.p2 TRINITY_DN8244_c0_g1~~TRINITY_DN8244_c0_g1_i1.p2  ORF type:complete len:299 (+),score=34.57 TRINITY_DN8244_c0_g1_i1:33-899(+)